MMARVSRKANAAQSVREAERIYNVAVYIRLSDEDIRKKISGSIGAQKSILLRFLETQPDLELYEIYEDINYTGTNFNRPAFTQMTRDIQNGLVDCVLVKDLSRFGRSFEEMGNYLERVFPAMGVRFISIGDDYDSLTASLDESGLIVPLKNLMNEVYARDISRKVSSGVRLKQKRGEFVGSIAPYGYIKDGASFIVDAEAAPIVRQIFEWIIDGMSDIAIAQKLNDMDIPPPSRYRFEKGITQAGKYKDARFWYKSAVKRISGNPAYRGAMAQGGRSDEWIVVENTHPAIISGDTFEAVQKIRDARKQNYKANRAASDNIFKGRIVCGDCKACMVRGRLHRAHGDEYFFECNVYEQVDKNACRTKRVMESELQAALFAYISREISLAPDMNRIITDMQKPVSYQKQRSALDKRLDALQKKLAHNRRLRGSLWEDYQDGVLSEQDYAVMRGDYDREKDELTQGLNVLLAEKSRRESTSTDNKWLAELKRFESQRQLSAQMVAVLVERIEVYGGKKIAVALRYRDELRNC